MERHPEYKYKIGRLEPKASWICIEDMNASGWGKEIFDTWSDERDNGSVEFLLRIKEENNWSIKNVEPFKYQFIEDELEMVFQWDDLFGFTIQIKEWNMLGRVLDFLKSYVE